MNRWRAYVAGQVAARPGADPARDWQQSGGHVRSWGRNDARAKRKRIARWRARKGYK